MFQIKKACGALAQSKFTNFAVGVSIGFIALSILHAGLPGLYMDSVNPDYLVNFLIGDGKVPAWIYPDNYLAGLHKYPVLNSLYGTALVAYIFAPFYLLLGSDPSIVRLLHVALGALVLFQLTRVVRLKLGFGFPARAATLALATLPAFVFIWRTQAYLQLFPMIFAVSGAFLLLSQSNSKTRAASTSAVFFGAILMGLAASSYFTYFIPAAIAVVVFIVQLIRARPAGIHPLTRALIAISGVSIGASPLFYGHLSIILHLGLEEYLGQLRGISTAYGVSSGMGSTFFDRIGDVWSNIEPFLIVGTFSFSPSAPGELIGFLPLPRFPDAAPWKFLSQSAAVLLAVLALVAVLVDIANYFDKPGAPRAALKFVFALWIVASVVFGLLAGTSLGYQHFVFVSPIIFIYGLSGALISTRFLFKQARPLFNQARPAPTKHRFALSTASAGLAVLICANLVAVYMSYVDLQRRGGDGLYSDAINDLGRAIRKTEADTPIVFPQWGFWMGAVMISEGRNRIWLDGTAEAISQRADADSRNCVVLVLGNNEKDRQIFSDLISYGWSAGETEVFRGFEESVIASSTPLCR